MQEADKKNQLENSEDIVYESDITADGDVSVDYKNKIKKIKEDLEICQKEKQEYLDGWQRAKADFVNYKKRTEEEKKETIKYATKELILEIIPAIDNFEHAFKDKVNWEKVPKEWRQGVEFIYSQLKDTLGRHGVSEINPINELFDPKLHHSIDVVPVNEVEKDGKIVEVVQKGYAFGDKIIRHPNVRVGEKR
jgi:molecular chaperone GrpE